MHPISTLLTQRWSGISGNVQGGLLVLLAGLFVAIMSSLIKHIGQEIAVVEILFIRQICVLLFISPVIFKHHRTVLQSDHKRVYFLRTVISAIAMITGFTAVVHLPLAEVTAISFGRILFTTMLAIIILKEVVGIRRWSGTLVGFIGVLIVVRPDMDSVDIYAVLAIISAFFVAANMIILRKITQFDPPSTIMTYQTLLVTLVMAVPAYFYWETPTFSEFLIMLTAGGLVSIAQYLTIKAFKVGEAAAISPMEYGRLLFAILIGIYYFDEIPTVWTLTGAVIIVGSTLYTLHRNAVRKQKINTVVSDS